MPGPQPDGCAPFLVGFVGRGLDPSAAARGLAALRTLVHVVGRGGIHPSRAPAHSCNILRAASIPPMRTGSYLRVPSSLKWFFKAFSVG